MRKILEYHLAHLYVQMDNQLQNMDDVSAMYDMWNQLTYLVGRVFDYVLNHGNHEPYGYYEPWRR